MKSCCFYSTENESGPNPTVAAGVHQYRFRFRLPEHSLPSSYEGEYGAIRYWLAFQIDRPLLRFNTERFKTITVLDHIDVNAPEYCVSLTGIALKFYDSMGFFLSLFFFRIFDIFLNCC